MRKLIVISSLMIAALITSCSSNQGEAFKYFVEGTNAVKAFDNKKALECYNKAIELDSNYSEAYFARAALEFGGDNLGIALKDANKAISINPKLPRVYDFRAEIQQLRGNTKGEIADLSQAILADSNDDEAYYSRGLARLELKDWDGAYSDYTKCLNINPNNDGARCEKGFMEIQKNDLKAAYSDFHYIIMKGPDMKAYEGIAETQYYQVADTASIIDDFKSAADQCNKWRHQHGDSLYYLGRIEEIRGHFETAFNYYSDAIKLSRFDGKIYNALGRGEIYFGRYKDALNCFDSAIKYSPTLGVAYFNRATTYDIISDFHQLKKYNLVYDSASVKNDLELGRKYGVPHRDFKE